jgi:hypothetical protein
VKVAAATYAPGFILSLRCESYLAAPCFLSKIDALKIRPLARKRVRALSFRWERQSISAKQLKDERIAKTSAFLKD